MNNLIKICLAIPSLGTGGMERVMTEIAWNFSKRENVELHLLMFGRTREIFYEIPKDLIVHKPTFEFDNRHRTLSTIRTISFIRKETKQIHPDVILSFGEIWNNFVMLSLLGLRFPIYVSDRCRPNKSFGKLHDTLRKRLYPKATGVIAQTQKAKELYKTQFKHENVVVIGNPIGQIASNGRIERENIVVSVGRLIDTKHFDQLIEIFSKIDKPDWKLVIVGGDALKQTNSILLQRQIDEFEMSDRIILAGTQKDVNGYLLRSKIFAFTSSSEGFPNVIGEAMSAGLPVVAYDCVAGPSDMIVEGENGFLIPLFDKEMFVEKLKYLMENEDEISTMGASARESMDRFSTDKICEAYYRVLTERLLQ